MRMLGQDEKRAAWSPRCERARLRTYTFGASSATIRPELFPALVALSRILRAHGRGPRQHDTWSYNCRKIAGSEKWSTHAYGVALDVRATDYPHGSRVTDPVLLAAALEVEQLVTPDGWRMWEWGGRWRRPDGMHWEIACPPASLARL